MMRDREMRYDLNGYMWRGSSVEGYSVDFSQQSVLCSAHERGAWDY